MEGKEDIVYFSLTFFATKFSTMQNAPDVIYGPLFEAVQMQEIFPDSKTFVDCIPKKDPENILEAYQLESSREGFDLKRFVNEYFEIPSPPTSGFKSDTNRPIIHHIKILWDVLKREKDEHIPGSSLLPLPYPYIVPGGRFNEIYYWDSFFTMQGLKADGKTDVIENMVKNFAYLIETVGFIPNGNRTYFLGRSQPPFFAEMVKLLAELKGKQILLDYLPSLKKEYDFWMRRSDGGEKAQLRTFETESGSILNRYWDHFETPRQESYKEDVHDAKSYQGNKEEFYRHIRAGAESGWDFSSRWFKNPDKISSIETTSILPVDLNCLLYGLEQTLELAYDLDGNLEQSKAFRDKAKHRAAAIYANFWDEAQGFYFDYHLKNNNRTDAITAAGIFPLYFKLATPEQAKKVATFTAKHLLKEGGLVTTTIQSGQQWDAPNGWAPLQFIAYVGFKNYGLDELADQIKTRWTDLCTKVYQNTGKMMEKYNVEDMNLDAGGGEYPVQDGFGWSNGVVSWLLAFGG
ncbi:MAG: alpha,alpha-trehalase TreF [Saprospiraceae bacterium]